MMRTTDDDATEYVTIYTDIAMPTDKSLVTEEGGSGGEFQVSPDKLANVYPIASIIDALEAQHAGKVANPSTSVSGAGQTVGGQVTQTFSGSYRGEAGTFTCNGEENACTANAATTPDEGELQYDDDGNLAVMVTTAGTWYFRPTNADATVAVQDSEYAYFGWWKVLPEAAADGSYVIEFRALTGGQGMYTNNFGNLEGEASFRGKAAGKYAMTVGSRFTPTYVAGLFTADATLKADFGVDMLSGTIDGFMAEDGTEMAGDWSVTLSATTMSADGVTSGTSAAEIHGDETGTGAWAADFFGNGRNDEAPETVVGTFDASFTDAGTSLAGAYGAQNVTADSED